VVRAWRKEPQVLEFKESPSPESLLETANHRRREPTMTTETVEAVYESGTFRLAASADMKLTDGQKVRLVVEAIEQPDEILALAARVYEGLTCDEIDSIEEHSRRRQNFFGERKSA
jgi:predicted DNA-binding antitoxin AbrB/MazE fold protein